MSCYMHELSAQMPPVRKIRTAKLPANKRPKPCTALHNAAIWESVKRTWALPCITAGDCLKIAAVTREQKPPKRLAISNNKCLDA